MSQQYLIDRIIKDAQDESRAIISAAKKLAKDNIEYAKVRAAAKVKERHESHKQDVARAREIMDNQAAVTERLIDLDKRSQVVDAVFDSAFDKIKFNWRIEPHAGYELRLTRDELMAELRGEIETEVCEILFGGQA